MIKVLAGEQKILLQVNGGERTISQEELIAILEKDLCSKITQIEAIEITQTPIEGKYFEVNPQAINQDLFKKKKWNAKQENTRKIILEAFAQVKRNPKKYDKSFKTLIPNKTWTVKTVDELKEIANNYGGHMADWVEQALEWAQRIANGEKWEDICNTPDTANWYRIIKWKTGYMRIIGGSCIDSTKYYVSDVSQDCSPEAKYTKTVPLVVVEK